MDKINKNNTKLKKLPEENKEIQKVIILLGILGVIAIGISIFVVQNNFPSKASNDAWLSYMGSFFGAILTAIVTFLVLFRTNKLTRRIQNENNKMQYIQIDRMFTNEIAEHISIYITDINLYFHNQFKREKISGDKINRVRAVEMYQLLTIKLNNIEKAEKLLEILKSIHNEYCFVEKDIKGKDATILRKNFYNSCENLRKETTNFISIYSSYNSDIW